MLFVTIDSVLIVQSCSSNVLQHVVCKRRLCVGCAQMFQQRAAACRLRRILIDIHIHILVTPSSVAPSTSLPRHPQEEEEQEEEEEEEEENLTRNHGFH